MKETKYQDLITILFERKELSHNHERMLRLFMNEWNVTAFDALIETKIFSEGRLADIICEHFKYKRAETIEQQAIDASVSNKIPYAEARRLSCLALDCDEDGVYRVAVCDPTQDAVFSTLQKYLGSLMIPLISTRSEINLALNDAYSAAAQFGGG